MPIYVYRCSNCGINIEKLETIHASATQQCECCGHTDGLKRQIANSSFAFAGSGWYKDSYSKK